MAQFDEKAMLAEQNAVMDFYKSKGFVKSKQDEEALHMSYSPYRVPKKLSKLQIRRRINKYLRGEIKEPSLREILGNRVDVHFNGKLIMGINTTSKMDTQKERIEFFKAVVAVMKAPRKAIKGI